MIRSSVTSEQSSFGGASRASLYEPRVIKARSCTRTPDFFSFLRLASAVRGRGNAVHSAFFLPLPVCTANRHFPYARPKPRASHTCRGYLRSQRAQCLFTIVGSAQHGRFNIVAQRNSPRWALKTAVSPPSFASLREIFSRPTAHLVSAQSRSGGHVMTFGGESDDFQGRK